MKIELKDNGILVTKEKGDKGFYDGSWGSGESRLLYKVQQWLNKNKPIGGDVHWIKKRMYKDNHMVSEQQLYIRTQKPVKLEEHEEKVVIAFWNAHWQIKGLNDDFNQNGKAEIQMEII